MKDVNLVEIRWYKNGKETSANEEGKPKLSSTPVTRGRLSPDLIGDIVSRHTEEGGFDNLEGKGKPLDLTGDSSFEAMVNRIMKEAGVLPPWLELQKEILSDLERALELHHLNQDIADRMEQINEKIRRYNSKCPSALLQRPYVQVSTLEQSLERWR